MRPFIKFCSIGSSIILSMLTSSVKAEVGSYSEKIPIVVPARRLGIQPNLSLTYNSKGGNGSAGVGWTLQGISKYAIKSIKMETYLI